MRMAPRARLAGSNLSGWMAPAPDSGWGLAALGLVPAIVFLAHFFYGAVLDQPAMALFAALSTLLLITLLARRAREDLARLTPAAAVLLPFAAVILMAVLSLTPAAPGGPHPIWEWAGMAPAATMNKSATLIEIFKLLGLGSVFILGCLLGATSERGRTVFGLILVLGCLYAIACLGLFLAGGQFAAGGGRLAGGFATPNVAGTQFGVLVVLASAWGVQRWRRASVQTAMDRIAGLAPLAALLILFFACLLLTASRAAITATLVAVLIFLGWSALDDRRSRGPLLALGGLLIVVAVLLLVQGNTLFADRFGSFAQGDDTRSIVAAAHWRAFLDSPLIGYGLGTYPQVNNQIMTASNAGALSVSVVQHNAYLQWLEEAGLLGATPMFALVAIILAMTAWRSVHLPRNRTLVAGLLSASVVVLLHAAVDVPLNTPSFEAFWTLLLGLGFALSQARPRAFRSRGTAWALAEPSVRTRP